MKVRYGDLWLSGSTPGEELREHFARISQLGGAGDLAGSPGASLYQWGNRYCTFPVRLTSGHAGELEALLYCHRLPWILPDKAPLLFREELPQAREWLYADATWTSLRASRDGVSVSAEIVFIAAGAPAASP